MKRTLLIIFVTLFGLSLFAQQTETLSIQGDHGKLSCYLQTPKIEKGKKVDAVLLLHGFGSSKNDGLMTMIAQKLADRGIASIRFDFNGHGESEGEFQQMTVLNELEDAKCVYEYIRALPYVKNISVCGHSQGGVVTGLLAGELGKKALKKAVLMAPAAVLREDAIRGNTFGKMYDPINPPEYIELWGGQKLGRNYILTARNLPIYERSCTYTGKVSVIHGTGDVVVPFSYGEHYAHDFKHAELHLLDGFDHGFSQDAEQATNLAVDFLAN